MIHNEGRLRWVRAFVGVARVGCVTLFALHLGCAEVSETGSDVLAADSAALTWDANNEADLAGYLIYHSQASQAYTRGLPVAKVPKGETRYVFSDLSSGRHYFSVTAYDTSGMESALSNEVFKDVP